MSDMSHETSSTWLLEQGEVRFPILVACKGYLVHKHVKQYMRHHGLSFIYLQHHEACTGLSYQYAQDISGKHTLLIQGTRRSENNRFYYIKNTIFFIFFLSIHSYMWSSLQDTSHTYHISSLLLDTRRSDKNRFYYIQNTSAMQEGHVLNTVHALARMVTLHANIPSSLSRRPLNGFLNSPFITYACKFPCHFNCILLCQHQESNY